MVALGGNALASPDDPSGDTAEHQIAQIAHTSAVLAEIIDEGHTVVITHGNGPQVGDLLVKNDLARNVVPVAPLYWCVAQTQATIGMELAAAMRLHLSARGRNVPVVPLLTRVRVEPSDPAFSKPTKPIGLTIESAAPPDIELPHDHAWREFDKGQWRRVVPSPRPVEILDADAIALVLTSGGVVIACGGGGVPFAEDDGLLVGVDAVIDKDMTAVLLAELVGASSLAILTDVPGVAIDYGRPGERYLNQIEAPELRRYLDAGEFGRGSMDTKVEAALTFVDKTCHTAVIGSLDTAREAIYGRCGTLVTPSAA
ncbi:MAG: carbamate kinase [Alphaproteobacteria bacterium]|nr:carbamate kinase [Alphaproteobacteria bacterium]